MRPTSYQRIDSTRVRQLRLGRGLSQERLAVCSCLSSVTVWNAERFGFATPSTIRKLAAALRVSPDELLLHKGDPEAA